MQTLKHTSLRQQGHDFIEELIELGDERHLLYQNLSSHTKTRGRVRGKYKGFHFGTTNDITEMQRAVDYLERRLMRKKGFELVGKKKRLKDKVLVDLNAIKKVAEQNRMRKLSTVGKFFYWIKSVL